MLCNLIKDETIWTCKEVDSRTSAYSSLVYKQEAGGVVPSIIYKLNVENQGTCKSGDLGISRRSRKEVPVNPPTFFLKYRDGGTDYL